MSMVRPAHIRDGLSNTYWAGEKSLEPRLYATAGGAADNNSCYQGHDWDILRWSHVSVPPRQDQDGYNGIRNFGSPHTSGANFVFCDGSVQNFSYSIEPETFRLLGNRQDGKVIESF